MELVKEHFFYNQHFASKEALFEAVSEQLVKENYVKSSYCDALISRERKFPTGIESAVNLAIPHADPEHVKQSTFVVISLEKPLLFASMVEPEKFLEVPLVILLVLNDSKDQITFLQRITDLAGENEMLLEVLRKNHDEQFTFFQNFFSQI